MLLWQRELFFLTFVDSIIQLLITCSIWRADTLQNKATSNQLT